MLKTEMYEFTREEVKDLKETYNAVNAEVAIEKWVINHFGLEDIDYDIDAKERIVTICYL